MGGIQFALLALDLLDTLIVLAREWPSAKAEVEETRLKVQEMVAEGRDPTAEEFGALALKNRLLTIRLKAAAERAQGD